MVTAQSATFLSSRGGLLGSRGMVRQAVHGARARMASSTRKRQLHCTAPKAAVRQGLKTASNNSAASRLHKADSAHRSTQAYANTCVLHSCRGVLRATGRANSAAKPLLEQVPGQGHVSARLLPLQAGLVGQGLQQLAGVCTTLGQAGCAQAQGVRV